jgi:hypothetical protein
MGVRRGRTADENVGDDNTGRGLGVSSITTRRCGYLAATGSMTRLMT